MKNQLSSSTRAQAAYCDHELVGMPARAHCLPRDHLFRSAHSFGQHACVGVIFTREHHPVRKARVLVVLLGVVHDPQVSEHRAARQGLTADNEGHILEHRPLFLGRLLVMELVTAIRVISAERK